MRLLVIGTSPRAQIRIVSQFASGYHAEIIQLDNGDMFIVDKNSTNGTFVNGQKIESDREVPINRGANVMLADVPLDWNAVPQLVVDRNAKALIGIGTHFRNKVRLSGDRASRFHATFKQTKDGKWWICDHSTNGTTVNGSRITRDRFVQLKRGDKISCAGQAVENPVKGPSVGTILGIVFGSVAAIAAVLALILLIPWRRTYTDEQLYNKYNHATVLVTAGYHLEAWADGEKLQSYYLDGRRPVAGDKTTHITATGFFISKDGYIATNLHVANPWTAVNIETKNEIKRAIVELLTAADLSWENSRLDQRKMAAKTQIQMYLQNIEIKGVLDYIQIIPNGEYFQSKNTIPCKVVATSSSLDRDIAILKTLDKQGELPKGCSFINIDKTSEVSPGEHVFALGFPYGPSLQDENQVLQVYSASGSVRQLEEHSFVHDAVFKSGASGSPVFNKYGELVGVHHAELSVSESFQYAIKAAYIKQLLNQENRI